MNFFQPRLKKKGARAPFGICYADILSASQADGDGKVSRAAAAVTKRP